MTEDITINDISHFLIENSYQLTALEFDFELIERGIESKFLRNFFTNPENFEKSSNYVEMPSNRMKASPSISTIDSIDFAKYSDDGMQLSDERIKVLEFELRKKNDEVRKLREELTLMSTSKTNNSFVIDWIPDSSAYNQNYENDEPLMAHENRALNFLINEYLLQNGFKLTAVSFSEEITDQDLDTWDDVGLNIPKLPNLECFIRAKRPPPPRNTTTTTTDGNIIQSNNKQDSHHDIEIQTDPMDQQLIEQYLNSNKQLEIMIESLNHEMESLTVKFERMEYQYKEQTQLVIQLKKEINDSRSKLICAQRDLMYESAKHKNTIMGNQSTSGDTDFKSETTSIISDAPVNEPNHYDHLTVKDQSVIFVNNDNDNKYDKIGSDHVVVSDINIFEEITTHRNPTPTFSKFLQLIQEDDQENGRNFVSLVDSLDQFVSLITDILPNLFEAIHDKNNSDLTMLLVQCACLHPDSKTRERLLKFLINIHPDPSSTERIMIMKQIHILSGYLGAFRVEAELITQIWEMMYEKPKPNTNKRILLSNICGVVCPLAPSNLRSSLILSIHQQMLEEESDSKVVPHIIFSIASTIPYLEDVDKIPHVINIMSKYLWKYEPILDGKKNSLNEEITAEDAVKCKLLPSVAQWCLDANILHTLLIHEILSSIKNLNMTAMNIDYYSISRHLNVIQLLLPFIEIMIKASTPQILNEIIDNDKEIHTIPTMDHGKMMELYQTDIIVSRDKYRKIHQSFVHYTGINIPKSLIIGSPEHSKDNDSTIQCWIPWPELKWIQTELINSLVCLLITIRPRIGKIDLSDPHVMSDLAKNQFTSAPLKPKDVCIRIGAILFELGCRFSASVISNVFVPCFTQHLFESSAKGVDCNLKSTDIDTGIVSGYCALLASLIQLDNSNMSVDNLKKFLTNISFLVAAENLPCDGIKLAVDVLSCGLGNVNVMSDIILSSLQPCIACPNISVRLFVCLMLQELVIQLSNFSNIDDNIFINILHSLRNLIDCPYESVKVMTVGPLVSLVQARSLSPNTRGQVYLCLSELMNESVNFKPEFLDKNTNSEPCTEVLITALIQMINVVGPTSPESFKDEAILPWLLGITEINNGTSDIHRRSGIAMILYSTFSTLSYYLESSNSLETCLLPALDRLRLDMLELYPENVKEVESMSQDIRKRIENKHKMTTLDSGIKSKMSGLNFMTRTANATSSATNSLFGKFKDLKDVNSIIKSEDIADTSSSTKSNITNFFSKRR